MQRLDGATEAAASRTILRSAGVFECDREFVDRDGRRCSNFSGDRDKHLGKRMDYGRQFMVANLIGPVAGGFGVIYLVVLVLMAVAWVKILTKAGYSGWWVLIAVVPLVNIIMFLVFAFSDWPALQQRGSRSEPAWPTPPTWPPPPV